MNEEKKLKEIGVNVLFVILFLILFNLNIEIFVYLKIFKD